MVRQLRWIVENLFWETVLLVASVVVIVDATMLGHAAWNSQSSVWLLAATLLYGSLDVVGVLLIFYAVIQIAWKVFARRRLPRPVVRYSGLRES